MTSDEILKLFARSKRVIPPNIKVFIIKQQISRSQTTENNINDRKQTLLSLWEYPSSFQRMLFYRFVWLFPKSLDWNSLHSSPSFPILLLPGLWPDFLTQTTFCIKSTEGNVQLNSASNNLIQNYKVQLHKKGLIDREKKDYLSKLHLGNISS